MTARQKDEGNAYVVEVKFNPQDTVRYWINQRTFLIDKISTRYNSNVVIEEERSDYRRADCMMLPFHIMTRLQGQRFADLTIDNYDLKTTVPAATIHNLSWSMKLFLTEKLDTRMTGLGQRRARIFKRRALNISRRVLPMRWCSERELSYLVRPSLAASHQPGQMEPIEGALYFFPVIMASARRALRPRERFPVEAAGDESKAL